MLAQLDPPPPLFVTTLPALIPPAYTRPMLLFPPRLIWTGRQLCQKRAAPDRICSSTGFRAAQNDALTERETGPNRHRARAARVGGIGIEAWVSVNLGHRKIRSEGRSKGGSIGGVGECAVPGPEGHDENDCGDENGEQGGDGSGGGDARLEGGEGGSRRGKQGGSGVQPLDDGDGEDAERRGCNGGVGVAGGDTGGFEGGSSSCKEVRHGAQTPGGLAARVRWSAHTPGRAAEGSKRGGGQSDSGDGSDKRGGRDAGGSTGGRAATPRARIAWKRVLHR